MGVVVDGKAPGPGRRADLQIERMEGVVAVEDMTGAEGAEAGFQAVRFGQPEECVRHEITHRQASMVLHGTRAQVVQRPDFRVRPGPTLRARQFEHHLLHPAGVGPGDAIVDHMDDGLHRRGRAPGGGTAKSSWASGCAGGGSSTFCANPGREWRIHAKSIGRLCTTVKTTRERSPSRKSWM